MEKLDDGLRRAKDITIGDDYIIAAFQSLSTRETAKPVDLNESVVEQIGARLHNLKITVPSEPGRYLKSEQVGDADVQLLCIVPKDNMAKYFEFRVKVDGIHADVRGFSYRLGAHVEGGDRLHMGFTSHEYNGMEFSGIRAGETAIFQFRADE